MVEDQPQSQPRRPCGGAVRAERNLRFRSQCNVHFFEVIAICAGLAGTARPENRDHALRFLKEKFPNAIVDVRTDLELVLSAMPAGPAIVLVCGTGSAAIGRDAFGMTKREGGFGPANSDEGSAYDIGRAAIAAGRSGPSSAHAEEFSRQILHHLAAVSWAEVDSRAVANADTVFPRVFRSWLSQRIPATR